MLERSAWLADDVLLLAGPGSEADQQELEASSAAIGNRTLDVVTRALSLSNGNEAGSRLLAVSHFGTPLNGSSEGLTMTFGPGGATLSVDAAQLIDSAALVRGELGRLDPEQRGRALHFLWTAVAPSLERSGSFPLAELLAGLHRELRPPLPQMFRTADEHYAGHVDVVLKLDERSVWVQGWLHDRDDEAVRLTLLAAEGGRAELLEGIFLHRRNDIEQVFGDKVGVRGQRQGFARFAEFDGPSHVTAGWLLELETASGDARQQIVPPVETDPTTTRERILPCLAFERPGSDELMRAHVHPAMSRIQDGLRDAPAIEAVVQLGDPPASPSVSVIVPLYAQLWFLEYQMAHWASDPQLAGEDLIYVLDSPEQAAVLDERAHGLYSIYGIPFRLAVMKGNAGFAGANNRAAELARADKLLLLNSDVVPDTPGWLARMSAFYDATPDIGTLGPKLLYEDDSIQHAGLYFNRLPQSPPVWENMSYFKGQHRSLPAANVARQVPAVTGACMMVARDLYERMSGLSYRYIVGGYEDSDFCLRLNEDGREHWYMPGAELYHMEDQSYPKELRKLTTRYNRWFQTELWGERMEQLMAQYPGHDG